jgi:hypothetical protein
MRKGEAWRQQAEGGRKPSVSRRGYKQRLQKISFFQKNKCCPIRYNDHGQPGK